MAYASSLVRSFGLNDTAFLPRSRALRSGEASSVDRVLV
jgi:hypothetical protein